MSDEQDWAADTTTQGPPRSYHRQGVSIVSSSQLSPKSPTPWDNDRESRAERNSWGEPGEERIDRRRRSTVTFGGATSVAPSDSISKVKSKSGRDSGDGTQYSRRSRRRSAPWQDVDYRSNYPSKAGSSQGGTHGGALLTEGNLEELNERSPPRNEEDIGKEVERDADWEEVDRKSSRKSRRDSGVGSQRRSQAGTRRASKQYSRVERESEQGAAEKTVVTTRSRRKTEVEEDGSDDEQTETKSKSRYESYSHPTRSTTSKVSERRHSRAADVYAQASARKSSYYVGGPSRAPKTTFTQRSRPPTMPPDNIDDAKSRRDIAVAAAGGAAASRVGGRSRAQTAYVEEDEEEETRQTEVKSSPGEDRNRQTEVKSERFTERGVDVERKSTASSKVSRRLNQASQAPTRPSQVVPATAAAAPSSPSSPTSPTSPTAEDDGSHWERRTHVTTTRKPDGRLIEDREVTMRRFRPHQEVAA